MLHPIGFPLFLLALVHSFLTPTLSRLANRVPRNSYRKFLHFFCEVEWVYPFWAGIALVGLFWSEGIASSQLFLSDVSLNEPLFVFFMVVLAATPPILESASKLLEKLSHFIPGQRTVTFYLSCIGIAPLLGSLITEPAALTISALLLRKTSFLKSSSLRFKYSTLGILLVNVSIGGLLTSFSAPPVILVAQRWGLTSFDMIRTFGWRAILVCFFNSLLAYFLNKNELSKQSTSPIIRSSKKKSSSLFSTVFHFLMMIFIIYWSHDGIKMSAIFLLFFFWNTFFGNEKLRIKEGLGVFFFLLGLTVLGNFQRVWIEFLLAKLHPFKLFLGTTFLTAILDNALLTYLGSLAPALSDASKYALVAGAVCGGGLTPIANAPNPAGIALLRSAFQSERVSILQLLKAALIPTLVAVFCFAFGFFRSDL